MGVNIDYEQAKRLGIAHLWPADLPKDAPGGWARGGKGRKRAAEAAPGPSSLGVRLPTKNAAGQNKTEAAFAGYLDDLGRTDAILAYGFEAMKFKLGPRTWYTPDFVAFLPTGRMIAIEVKGFMRDDAAIKFKLAPVMHGQIQFFMVKRVRRRWEWYTVTTNGITACLPPF